MSFLKLVNFEIRRFAKIYGVLVLLAVGLQLIGTVVVSKMYAAGAFAEMRVLNQSIEEFSKGMKFKMDFTYILSSMWTLAPIALCICALLFYIFFIWYRDWFAANAFIYRLLMLPSARMNLFLSKAAAIFLMTVTLVGIEALLLPVENSLFQSIVPYQIRNNFPLSDSIDRSMIFTILLPKSLTEFIVYYGVGLAAVLVIFTAILFERSFKMQGIILGIIYCCLILAFLLIPVILLSDLIGYLYPSEIILVELGLIVVSAAVSVLTSRYLINKKITV
ncbi:hypothetical protein LRR81_15640 [Metabacillus sp. GX 13764]|uniref:hypothetical protein n=1 Tax=Metabacillus kandeliae TaxID=2900151 RepID=UPI001E50734A|nr:hypothetical protein [Metabacillus kandeliae]MCD7035677.1 hypothetical protein [Metabacillus kandeliae]